MSEKAKNGNIRIAAYITAKTKRRIDELAEAMQISRSAVISEAVAVWYREEQRRNLRAARGDPKNGG